MDAREKAKKAIEAILRFDSAYLESEVIVDLPELESYFREKFENEPGRLVAEKECPGCTACKPFLSNGFDCDGTGTIKRRMTRKEVEEWAYKIALYHGKMNYCLPIDGERVSVEEK